MKSDLVDITVQLHFKSEKALFVSLDGDKKKAVWLPLSVIEWVYKKQKEGILEITLPEWLAYEKGLL